jgi:hypothetical protein
MASALSITSNARVLLLCLLAVLSACQKDPGTAPTPTAQVKAKPKATVKPGPTAAELTTGMVEAAGQGKSQGPVDLKFELPQKPKVGQAMEINLALLPQIDAALATVQVAAADGFTVNGGEAPFEIPTIKAGEVYRHTVSILPTVDGVLVIGVTLQLKTDDNVETRAFSIPVIVDR